MSARRLTLFFSVVALALSVAVGIASADNIVTDEADTVTANDTTVALGTVTGGAPITRHVSFQLNCNSNGHVDANEAVVLTESGSTVPAGGSLSATTSRIVRPATWPADGNSCGATPNADDSGNSVVTITPPTTAGNYTFKVNWAYSEDDTTTPAVEATSVTGDIQGQASTTVTYTMTVAANSAPSTPGAPSLASGFLTPNRGVFNLTWAASTDPNGDAVSYTLQHKDANDAAYSTVATGIGTNLYSFGALSTEAEGTWTYQARASDGSLTSAFSGASSAVKVDKSNPNPPTISANKAADYTSGGTSWFKGSVTLSFGSAGDPDLADGSAGSGVDLATLPASGSRSTTGTLSVSGTVKDNVGNESASASKSVKVDAGDPSVSFSDCPSAPLHSGDAVTIHYSASDDAGGSGLVEAASGSFALDTSVDPDHTRSQSVTVHDNVGNSKTATCNYTVDSAPSKPGTPVPDESSNRDGQFGLTWGASTDADDPDSAITYTLQHKDADDGAWTNVAAGLSAASYSFTSGNPEAEGTWTYRVIADDGIFSSTESDASSAVKVDKSNPSASVSATTSAAYSTATKDWWKDAVTLQMSGSDPSLADGSPGSGVDASTIEDPVTGSANGSYALSGTVKDNVGNESAFASKTAWVDAIAPSVTVTGCPTSAVLRTSSASISVLASDEGNGSGLGTDPTGLVLLDTSTEGMFTKTVSATDHVGHVTTRSCDYTVEAYGWSGWKPPVNGNALNVAKAGSSIPMKFSLGGYRGMANVIFAPAPAGSSNPSSAPTNCSTGGEPDPVDQTVTTNASGLSYDAVTDTYNYVWKTEKNWAGTCRQFMVKFADGYTRRANFNFTR
ncbi:MAG: PxKF domain-containing protein [Thermoleophilaceae bacterium]